MATDLLLGKTRRNWSRSVASALGSDDPLVWTPSAVRAELDRVRDVVDTINQEMSRARASKKISDAEWRGWFRTYQTTHKITDRGSALWGSNVLAARRHEQEAVRWRDLLKSRGAEMVGPRDMGRSPTGSLSLWAALVPALAGAAATGAVFYLLKKKT